MNFRQVRKKIKTISNVKQITRAMQMVSSVKMKKAQDAALESRLYREILNKIIGNVATKSNDITRYFKNIDTSAATKDLYLVISSNKGLCGSFNFNLLKLLLHESKLSQDDFIAIGKKGAEFLIKAKAHVIADFSSEPVFIDAVSAIFSLVKERFISGEYRQVYIVYNQFISTLIQKPLKKKLLPIEADFLTEEQQKTSDANAVYLIEPSPEEVVEQLIIDFLQDKIRGAFLDSEAAEQSARMMAMKNATDSAGDLIYNLTLLRNKLRQTSITNELLDITTAKISSEISN